MDITLPTLIDLFVATKQTEGKSVHTTDWYRRMLRRFAAYARNGSEARLEDVTLETARAFVGSLREQSTRDAGHPIKPERDGGLSPNTIDAHVRALKAFST